MQCEHRLYERTDAGRTYDELRANLTSADRSDDALLSSIRSWYGLALLNGGEVEPVAEDRADEVERGELGYDWRRR